MRVLASFREIGSVRHHHNADALDIVSIDGWDCISKRDAFKAGDVAVYFEIGAFLPIKPQFEFLRKSSYKTTDSGEGFRIKTIKLRGEIAQGLLMPIIDVFPEGVAEELCIPGTDLTDLIGVVKYESPVTSEGSGVPRGNFPDFIPKTDQERLQNIYNRCSQYYKNDTFEVTLKLDGSSMTVYHLIDAEGDKSGVCSRNNDLDLSPEGGTSNFSKVAVDGGILAALSAYCVANGRSLALQGELMGPGVQGNREKLQNHFMYLFDVFDITAQKYLSPDERLDVFYELLDDVALCNNPIPLRHVPVIKYIELFEEFGNIHDICNWVDEAESIDHKYAEGFVFKHLNNPKVSFKVISRNFLLKCDTEN